MVLGPIENLTNLGPDLLSLPSLNKSLALMKPRVSLTMPSSRGCVGTKGVKPTDTPTELPTHHEKVSWRDVLFPRKPLADVDL